MTDTIPMADLLLSDWIYRRYVAWSMRQVQTRRLRPMECGPEEGRVRDDGGLDLVTTTRDGELVFPVPKGHWERR